MPEPLDADRLEASLTVNSVDQSTSWYTDMLGFVVDQRHEREGRLFKRRGGILDPEPTTVPWGARNIRFRDPDGFRFTQSSTAAA